jgi:hypothetical protein
MNCILYIFVLCSSVYVHGIDATGETNSYDSQNNDLRILNYTNSNIINLTNNDEDSIYGQIESFENNVYVVWQESVTESLPEHNYDVFFVRSEDKGKTFDMPINLSNNTKFSERPQIAVSNFGIFVVWSDTTNFNNKEIMFTKSLDNGKTFSKVMKLSNNTKNSYNQEISVFNDNVYVVWLEQGHLNNTEDGSDSIIFKKSTDSGTTFNNSTELVNNTNNAFPKINSYVNNVYIVWNNENKKSSDISFVKSSNKGNNFDKIIKLSDDNNVGESQIAVDENGTVIIVWGGLLAKNIDNIYYVKSNDNGNTFTDSKTLSGNKLASNNINDNNELNKIVNNPLNVEVANNNNLSSIVWQNAFSKQNEDILILLLTNQEENNHVKLLNLSNNPSVSECPSITISNGNIYVIWEDYIHGNHEILFAKISTKSPSQKQIGI